MHDDEYMYKSGDIAQHKADDNRKRIEQLEKRVTELEEALARYASSLT